MGGGFFEAFLLEDAPELKSVCEFLGDLNNRFLANESKHEAEILAETHFAVFKKCLVGKIKTDKLTGLAHFFQDQINLLKNRQNIFPADWRNFMNAVLGKSLDFGSGLKAIPYSLDLSDPFHPISNT